MEPADTTQSITCGRDEWGSVSQQTPGVARKSDCYGAVCWRAGTADLTGHSEGSDGSDDSDTAEDAGSSSEFDDATDLDDPY